MRFGRPVSGSWVASAIALVELAGAVALQQREEHEQGHEEQQAVVEPGATNAITYPIGNSNRSTRYAKPSADARLPQRNAESEAVEEPRRAVSNDSCATRREHVDRPVGQVRARPRAGDEEHERRTERVDGGPDQDRRAVRVRRGRARAPSADAPSAPAIATTGTSWAGARNRHATSTGVVGSDRARADLEVDRRRDRVRGDAGGEHARGRMPVGGAASSQPPSPTQVERGEPGVGVRAPVRAGARRRRGCGASSTARTSSTAASTPPPRGRLRPRRRRIERTSPASADLNGSTKTSSMFHVAGAPLVVKTNVRFWVPSTPPSRFGMRRRLSAPNPSRPACAVDVEAGRQDEAGQRVLHEGLDVQHRLRRPRVLHEQADRVLAHRDAYRRRDGLGSASATRGCGCRSSRSRTTSRCPATTCRAGEGPTGCARLETTARHQEVGAASRPTARTVSRSCTAAQVGSRCGRRARRRERRGEPGGARPSAESDASGDGAGRRERRSGRCQAMVAFS